MMPGMEAMTMPGTLAAQQLIALNDSRGKNFDRRFLEGMIVRDQGAIAMVDNRRAKQ
jgi:uncharacterized protein (DUF305 family)